MMSLTTHIRPGLLVAAVAFLLSGCSGAEGSIRQGQIAPPLAITTLTGAQSEVRPVAGHPLWLNFWATWCYPCRAEWPGLNQAQRDLAGMGLTLVAISVNEQTTAVEQFLDKQPASFEVALDPQGQAAARYGVNGFPTHVLIDETGVVRAIVHGPLDTARARTLLSLTDQPYSTATR
jgi:cytochrome c biogenesis protein CcmG/thiol:disulfide interchange protein DsbE